jgi:hypothetical protein
MGLGEHAIYWHEVFQSQLFIERAKSVCAGLKVEPPVSNLGLYNQAIKMTVKNIHHALSGGLKQCNYTTRSTHQGVQDLKTSLKLS